MSPDNDTCPQGWGDKIQPLSPQREPLMLNKVLGLSEPQFLHGDPCPVNKIYPFSPPQPTESVDSSHSIGEKTGSEGSRDLRGGRGTHRG